MSAEGLEAEKERRRETLTRDFASGLLTEEEAEAAFSRIAVAGSLQEMDEAFSPPATLADGGLPSTEAATPRSVFSFLGDAAVELRPEEGSLSATCLLGDMKLNLASAACSEIKLDLLHLVGDIKLSIPRRFTLVNEMKTLIGEVKDRDLDELDIDPSCIIVVTGFHFLGDLKVKRL